MVVALCKALYLFTRSDAKTILVPIISFAALSSFSPQILHSFIWVYTTLLQFCVSNQCRSSSIAEDKLNRPWRPIPACLITVEGANKLRWRLVPVTVFVSWYYNITFLGLLSCALIILNNELGWGEHWVSRHFMNAIGYAVFDCGATSIACGRGLSFETIATLRPQIINSLLIFTTIHAQVFRDVVGDRSIGRKTIPTEWSPVWARGSVAIGITAWSFAIGRFIEQWPIATTFVLLGLWTSFRFLWLTEPRDDEVTYTAYNVWLTMARITSIAAPRLSGGHIRP